MERSVRAEHARHAVSEIPMLSSWVVDQYEVVPTYRPS